LVLALDEALHLNMLENAKFVKGLLQNFEIGDVFIVELGLPVDFGHGELLGVE